MDQPLLLELKAIHKGHLSLVNSFNKNELYLLLSTKKIADTRQNAKIETKMLQTKSFGVIYQFLSSLMVDC